MNETTLTTVQSTNKEPLIVVVGATATGKTSAAIRLAHRFQGEIVSADSRYLYRGMNVGTATPTEAEMSGVPHHLISFLDPADDYSLSLYQRDALAAIADIHRRGRIPILAGGTPLYVNALLEGWHIPEAAPDSAFRAEMEQLVAKEGSELVHGQLAEIDPVAAARISSSNVRRVIRALEIHHVTGRRMSDLEGKSPPPFRALVIGLQLPRDELYRRIDERVDAQMAAGWADEVRRLLRDGVSTDSPAMSAIGYAEIAEMLRGEATLDETVERIKFRTHRYARHQLTWLRRMQRVRWFDPRDVNWFEQALELVQQFLAG